MPIPVYSLTLLLSSVPQILLSQHCHCQWLLCPRGPAQASHGSPLALGIPRWASLGSCALLCPPASLSAAQPEGLNVAEEEVFPADGAGIGLHLPTAD